MLGEVCGTLMFLLAVVIAWGVVAGNVALHRWLQRRRGQLKFHRRGW